MWKQFSTIGALAAILAVAPALAQEPASETSEPATAMEQSPADQDAKPAASAAPETDKVALTDDLLGKAVWSSDGEELGEVTKVNEGSDMTPQSIHFDIGTFLGMGGKTVEVGAEQFSQNDDRIELTMNAEEAEALSAVKTE